MHHAFFLHFSSVVARMRSERFVSFSKLRKSPFVFKSRKIRQHLANWMKWNERWSLKQRKFTFKWRFHRLLRRTSNSLYTSEKPYLEFWEEGFNFHSSFSSSKVALFVSFTFSSGGIKFSIINVLSKRKTKSSAFPVMHCTHYMSSYWLTAYN